MKNGNGIRRLGKSYSSPYGRVHNHRLTSRPKSCWSATSVSSIGNGHLAIDEKDLLSDIPQFSEKNEEKPK